eukprot:359006-Chlamydomonas_euryale.AAC.1
MRLRSNFQPALHTAWSWCDRMACVCVPTSNLHFILRGHGVIGCRLVCAHVSLQSRLDEDTASLAKRQAAFNRDRDQMSNEEEEEYQKAVEESMFSKWHANGIPTSLPCSELSLHASSLLTVKYLDWRVVCSRAGGFGRYEHAMHSMHAWHTLDVFHIPSVWCQIARQELLPQRVAQQACGQSARYSKFAVSCALATSLCFKAHQRGNAGERRNWAKELEGFGFPALSKAAMRLLPMHATSAAVERFNSTYGAMYTAERSSLAFDMADKIAGVRTMENFSRYQQTARPEIATMRLMDLVDKSKGYLKRLRAAEVAAPVAEGPTTRGHMHARPRTK